MVSSIGTHRYKDGIVQIRVTYQDGVTTWMDVDDLKSVYPNILAHYVLKYDMGEIVNGKYRRWTTSFLRSLQVVEQRQRRTQISGFQSRTFASPDQLAVSHPYKRIRRIQPLQTKNKRKSKRTFKYGLEVPRTWKDVVRLDNQAGDGRWQETIRQEVDALIKHDCFDLRTRDYKPSPEYQYCRLHFVYDIKQDLRYKARLVCNGKLVDAKGMSTRATVV